MNRLDYVNKLLESDDLCEYIKSIEKSSSVSPPKDLKQKILNKCYNFNDITNNQTISNSFKYSLADIIKVACFALIITLGTELFMGSSYASTKSANTQMKNKQIVYKISDKIDCAMENLSGFMLNNNLKGD